MTSGNGASTHPLFPFQIFPIASLKVSATRSLMDLLLAIVSRYPHLVLSSRRLFLDFLSARSNSEGKEELLLHIAWLVGTYATPMVDSSLAGEVLFEFYEVRSALFLFFLIFH